jgi:hypothetical protein
MLSIHVYHVSRLNHILERTCISCFCTCITIQSHYAAYMYIVYNDSIIAGSVTGSFNGQIKPAPLQKKGIPHFTVYSYIMYDTSVTATLVVNIQRKKKIHILHFTVYMYVRCAPQRQQRWWWTLNGLNKTAPPPKRHTAFRCICISCMTLTLKKLTYCIFFYLYKKLTYCICFLLTYHV